MINETTSTNSLECPAGQTIMVDFANYGRYEGADVCPHKTVTVSDAKGALAMSKSVISFHYRVMSTSVRQSHPSSK